MDLLKLKITDPIDLRILSPYIQDSICHVTSMYLDKDNNFHLLLNRFCWEIKEQNYRINSRISCSKVINVFKKGFHQAGNIRLLNLITLKHTKNGLSFLFSEHHELFLECSDVNVFVSDVPHHWCVHNRPFHNINSLSNVDIHP